MIASSSLFVGSGKRRQVRSSIKDKAKVSHFADKKIISSITMASVSAKRGDKEIGDYYIRKTAEGKNPMLVMNAIRHKILSRTFQIAICKNTKTYG